MFRILSIAIISIAFASCETPGEREDLTDALSKLKPIGEAYAKQYGGTVDPGDLELIEKITDLDDGVSPEEVMAIIDAAEKASN